VVFGAEESIELEIDGWSDLLEKSDIPVRIILETIPSNTPQDDDIYLATNFNNWRPGSSRYKFEIGPDGKYFLDIPRDWGDLEFKVTRGNWKNVECSNNGEEIPNRSYQFGKVEVIRIDVEGWQDLF
jgi:hypothetical protein